MKTIYLRKDYEGNDIEYENIIDIKNQLSEYKIEIGEGAQIGEEAQIGEWAQIGAGAKIGEEAKIGAGAKIGEEAKIGEWAQIGEEAQIGAAAEIGEGAQIGARAKIGAGAEIDNYNYMFCLNIYKYVSGSWLDKNTEWIQLGCYTRTRKEWEEDFWNNINEFPNDGSEKSNARLRAFKVHCFFLDQLKST